MARRIARYGWKRSLPDHRDLMADPAGLTAPPEVDPRADMPRIFDQGQLGSCTANAVAAAIEYDWILDNAGGHVRPRPSRLFIYYCERMIEGSLGQGDTGAFGRDGFKAAARYGYVVRRPSGPTTSLDTPTIHRRRSGRTRCRTCCGSPTRPSTRSVEAMKAVLSNKQTMAFGFSVYESFDPQRSHRRASFPMPDPSERMLGGHEVLAVGYLEDHPDHALCRNSWGIVGLAGYFLMPWDYLMNPGLSDDFWTIVRAT